METNSRVTQNLAPEASKQSYAAAAKSNKVAKWNEDLKRTTAILLVGDGSYTAVVKALDEAIGTSNYTLLQPNGKGKWRVGFKNEAVKLQCTAKQVKLGNKEALWTDNSRSNLIFIESSNPCIPVEELLEIIKTIGKVRRTEKVIVSKKWNGQYMVWIDGELKMRSKKFFAEGFFVTAQNRSWKADEGEAKQEEEVKVAADEVQNKPKEKKKNLHPQQVEVPLRSQPVDVPSSPHPVVVPPVQPADVPSISQLVASTPSSVSPSPQPPVVASTLPKPTFAPAVSDGEKRVDLTVDSPVSNDKKEKKKKKKDKKAEKQSPIKGDVIVPDSQDKPQTSEKALSNNQFAALQTDDKEEEDEEVVSTQPKGGSSKPKKMVESKITDFMPSKDVLTSPSSPAPVAEDKDKSGLTSPALENTQVVPKKKKSSDNKRKVFSPVKEDSDPSWDEGSARKRYDSDSGNLRKRKSGRIVKKLLSEKPQTLQS